MNGAITPIIVSRALNWRKNLDQLAEVRHARCCYKRICCSHWDDRLPGSLLKANFVGTWVNSPGECVISMASIWEASIKIGLGKLKLPYDLRSDLPRLLDDNGLSLLDIDLDDALSVVGLPLHHVVPFDRIMVAQAMRRNLRIISRDPIFTAYGLKRIW